VLGSSYVQLFILTEHTEKRVLFQVEAKLGNFKLDRDQRTKKQRNKGTAKKQRYK